MTVTVRRAAEADLEQAFDYYETVRSGLGIQFLESFRRGIASILDHPGAWQALDEAYRRYRLRRFPYGIIYRIDEPAAEIIVVAIPHLHRRPDDWRKTPDIRLRGAGARGRSLPRVNYPLDQSARPVVR